MSVFRNRSGMTSLNIAFAVAVFFFLIVAFVPAIVKWVDQNNYDLDQQTAQRMTEAIKWYEDDIFRTSLDAYDVRMMVRDALGHETSFTQTTDSAAFFYDSKTHTIEIKRYRDLDVVKFIGDNQIRQSVTPEEVFREGLFMLSTDGSVLAESIKEIRDMIHGDVPLNTFASVSTRLSERKANPLNRMYAFGINQIEIEVLQKLMTMADPETTLFVRNQGWYTAATVGSEIEHLIFDHGIETIPGYGLGDELAIGEEPIAFNHVIIPKTVNKFEHDAFPGDVMTIAELVIKTVNGTYVNHEAFDGVVSVTRDCRFFDTEGLINFSEHAVFTTDSEGIVSASFSQASDVINQHGITTYESNQRDGILFIELYANEFLIGYASNAYVFEYRLFVADLYPYHVVVSDDLRFDSIQDPVVDNMVFLNWFDYDYNPLVYRWFKLHAMS